MWCYVPVRKHRGFSLIHSSWCCWWCCNKHTCLWLTWIFEQQGAKHWSTEWSFWQWPPAWPPFFTFVGLNVGEHTLSPPEAGIIIGTVWCVLWKKNAHFLISTLQRRNTKNLKQIIPGKELRDYSPMQFLHSSFCERFIYSADRFAYSAAAK
jgi:hypothetical protein